MILKYDRSNHSPLFISTPTYNYILLKRTFESPTNNFFVSCSSVVQFLFQATVYCLVRNTSTENFSERLSNLLKSRSLSQELVHSRIIPLPGNNIEYSYSRN